MNNWQSLETAPKDGTHVLFYYQGSVYTAWYEEYNGNYWYIDSPCDNCWYAICDPNPTNSFWQPIIYPDRCKL